MTTFRRGRLLVDGRCRRQHDGIGLSAADSRGCSSRGGASERCSGTASEKALSRVGVNRQAIASMHGASASSRQRQSRKSVSRGARKKPLPTG
jgi:hypothetical protein